LGLIIPQINNALASFPYLNFARVEMVKDHCDKFGYFRYIRKYFIYCSHLILLRKFIQIWIGYFMCWEIHLSLLLNHWCFHW